MTNRAEPEDAPSVTPSRIRQLLADTEVWDPWAQKPLSQTFTGLLIAQAYVAVHDRIDATLAAYPHDPSCHTWAHPEDGETLCDCWRADLTAMTERDRP
jgi:hypothetical protein